MLKTRGDENPQGPLRLPVHPPVALLWPSSPGAGSDALVTPTSLLATTERLCAKLRSCSCTVWLVSHG